jgi:cell division protein FtsX
MSVLKQTRVVRADGSVESVTQVSQNPQAGSLIERLFEGMNREKEPIPDAIVVEKEKPHSVYDEIDTENT